MWNHNHQNKRRSACSNYTSLSPHKQREHLQRIREINKYYNNSGGQRREGRGEREGRQRREGERRERGIERRERDREEREG
jgi:hypothetical protein